MDHSHPRRNLATQPALTPDMSPDAQANFAHQRAKRAVLTIEPATKVEQRLYEMLIESHKDVDRLCKSLNRLRDKRTRWIHNQTAWNKVRKLHINAPLLPHEAKPE
jgi:hypothetical protein